jgi:hypothetical protein
MNFVLQAEIGGSISSLPITTKATAVINHTHFYAYELVLFSELIFS